jgi:hypothetical protein
MESWVGTKKQVLCSSNNKKTGRHDIAEILLKVALKRKKTQPKPY